MNFRTWNIVVILLDMKVYILKVLSDAGYGHFTAVWSIDGTFLSRTGHD
jgi:hypothetical protein